MRGPSEGLHEGPALGRGGRGQSATPQPMAGPRGRDRHAAPTPDRQEAAPGDQRAPLTPPPPRSHSGPRADGGRPRKRRPHTPPGEAAAPGVRGHHGRGRRPHALPAAGRRRTGDAQDGANGSALSEAGPGKTAPPPPPPPPAALTRQRLTGPRPTPAAARQPPRHEYTPRRHARDNGRQANARWGGGAGRLPPPPAPPPAREPQERPSAPPEPRPPPPPRRDRDAGGGGDAAGPAPAGVAAAGQAHTSVPEQRAHQNSMGAAPHMTLP